MAYLGNDLQVAYQSYQIIDDISSSFNGVLTTFPLQVGGVTPVPFPINPQQCLISVNGVIQEPDPSGTSGFNLVGSNIEFSSAPTGGHAFFGVILAGADYVNVGVTYPSGSESVPSITFDTDLDTGIFNSSVNELGLTTNGTNRLNVGANGQINILTGGSAGSPSLIFNTDVNSGLYSPGPDQVAISTNGTGRLFISDDGKIGIGTSTPSSYAIQADDLVIAPSTAYAGISLVASTANYIYFSDLDAEGRGFIDYAHGDDSLRFGTSANQRFSITSNGSVNIVGAGTPNVTQAVSFNGSAPVDSLVLTSQGRVGIGTGSPSYKLDVLGNSAQTIRVGSLDGDEAILSMFSDGNATWSLASDTVLRFRKDFTEYMRIDSSGRVGIGTSSPGTYNAKLAVYGTDQDGTRIALFRSSDAGTSISVDGGLVFGADVSTGGTARMKISSTGNVGVGTTSPATTLDVNGDVTITDKIIHRGDTDTAIRFPAADTVSVETGGSERARIDSSGRLLVGASSSRTNLVDGTLSAQLQVEGIDHSSSSGSFIRNSNTVGNAFLTLGKTRGTANGSNTIVQDGDGLGNLAFLGADGTNLIRAAEIFAQVDGTPGANDMPGRLVFSTTADGESFPTERMRLDSGGRLLVGTSTAKAFVTVSKTGTEDADLLIESESGVNYLIQSKYVSDGTGSNFQFRKYRGTIASPTIVNSDDIIGSFQFYGYDGTDIVEAAQIRANVEGTPAYAATALVNGQTYRIVTVGTTDFTLIGASANTVGTVFTATGPGTGTGTAILNAGNMPGRLVFSTTADGASSSTERMRLDSEGSLNIGCTSNPLPNNAAASLHILAPPAGGGDVYDSMSIKSEHPGNVINIWKVQTGSLIDFYTGTIQSPRIGYISTNGSSISYNTTSDYRLKENVVEITDGITRVKQLAPKRFNFIADADMTVDGFLAHEAQTVVPEAVTGTKDEVDDNGNPVMQGIDQSKFVPLLTAALQEAIAKIETLEAKVAALEAS